MSRLWFQPPPDASVLNPYNASEAITVALAAKIAGRSFGTIRNWCRDYCIGRPIAGGALAVSRPALQMLLNDDIQALRAHLSGDRTSAVVARYFQKLHGDAERPAQNEQCAQTTQTEQT
jgi:hypothetical protein